MTLVRFSVSQLDATLLREVQRGRPRPTTVLVDVLDDDTHLAASAIAWAGARGYHQLIPALERMLGGPPPEIGFAAIINKSHALLVFARWQWCPAPHIFDREPSTEWPIDEPEL